MTYEVKGIAREALEESWPFTFDGELYHLPPDMDVRAAALLSAGEIEQGLRVLLGEAQWDRLCASQRVFTSKDFTGLFAAYSESIGVDMGGIVSVVELLEENGDALEADLQRHYRVPLTDLYSQPKRLTWRRLLVLIHHLPADSATRLALDGGQSMWGLSEQLLAAMADTLRAANWQRSGGKGSRPKPIPRPGVAKPVKRRHMGRATRPPHEVAAYLARFRPQDSPHGR